MHPLPQDEAYLKCVPLVRQHLEMGENDNMIKRLEFIQVKKSKFIIVLTLLVVVLLGTSACANSSSDESPKEVEQSKSNALKSPDETTNDSSDDSSIEPDHTVEDPESVSNSPKQNAKEQKPAAENSNSNVEDENPLSQYSNEQIEYARVWLQLGPNQDIDELNARHIPAGEPINPNDDTSANYPEDVIQLAGSRLVDGSVTYSGNGDGTVNVYKVPLRWDGNYPAGEEFYIDIVESAELAHIAPNEDEEVIALIELLNIH